jgi:molybdate transport system substrate-binding protein
MQISACSIALVVLIGIASAGPAPQSRNQIHVWTARAIATVLAEIGPQFERSTGYALNVISDLPTGFARRWKMGEPVDLIITGTGGMAEWITERRVDPATLTNIARSAIGVAVREGAPKPDISSVEAFKRALLEAKSIAYLRVGSGVHVDTVIGRMGIAEAIKTKVTRPDTDIVSELVARGEVEVGIVVITQILTTPGVALAGPLPPEMQSHVTFAAAVGAKATSPDVAKRLIRFLTEPAAGAVMRRQGMEPASVDQARR